MDEFKEAVAKLKEHTQKDLLKYKQGKCTIADFYENVIMSCGVVIQRLTGHEGIEKILFEDCVNKIWEEIESEPKRP